MKHPRYYPLTVAGCARELPLCPLNDRVQIAGFVMLGDPELTTAWRMAGSVLWNWNPRPVMP